MFKGLFLAIAVCVGISFVLGAKEGKIKKDSNASKLKATHQSAGLSLYLCLFYFDFVPVLILIHWMKITQVLLITYVSFAALNPLLNVKITVSISFVLL